MTTPPIKCYLIEPVPGRVRRILRRVLKAYKNEGPVRPPCPKAPGDWSMHEARVDIGEYPRGDDGPIELPPPEAPAWPRNCTCGMQFPPEADYQVFTTPVYRRTDTGEERAREAFDAGAMYWADWMEEEPPRPFSPFCGPDGRSLIVVLPGRREWAVDGRANNCTLPADTFHRCWIRRGTPPEVTVDKGGPEALKAGKTCAAGAGSIIVPGWHGFLRGGFLVVS